MMNQNVLKIAVADESLIVRMGVLAALKRTLDANAACVEIATLSEFETRIMSFAPSIVVVSPSFGGRYKLGELRAMTDPYVKDVKFVALVSAVLPASVLDGYDAQLSIFDTEEDLQGLFDSLSGKDAEETDDTDGEVLSSREKQVIRGVVSGRTNKEIAEQMNISVYTVLTHRRNIARKLNIHSSIALAIYAISNKLVGVDEVKG